MSNKNDYKDYYKFVILAKKYNDLLKRIGIEQFHQDYDIAQHLNNLLIQNNVRSKVMAIEDSATRFSLFNVPIIVLVATSISDYSQGKSILSMVLPGPTKKKTVVITTEDSNGFAAEEIGKDGSILIKISAQNPFTKIVATLQSFSEVALPSDNWRISRELETSYRISEFPANTVSYITKRGDWLYHSINDWLNRRNQSKFFWLCGEHGTGKTVFVGDYFSGLSDNIIGKGIFYCRYSSKENQYVEHIIKAIAFKLCEYIPGYSTAIAKFNDDFLRNSDSDSLVANLLQSPFRDDASLIPAQPFVFIIDGLDELRKETRNHFLELLQNQGSALPGFIRFVLTSTYLDEIRTTMGMLAATIVDLNEYSFKIKNQSDAKSFLCNELSHMNINYNDGILTGILQKAEYNFDYLHFFLTQCEQDGTLPSIQNLPQGLTAMFQMDFNHKFNNEDYSKIKPILEVLCAAKEPYKVNDLAQTLNWDLDAVIQAINGVIKQYLIFKVDDDSGSEYLSLYKVFFRSWLVSTSHRFYVDVKRGNNHIVKWMDRDPAVLYHNAYLRRFGIAHITEDNNADLMIEKYICNFDITDDDSFEVLKEMLSRTFVDISGEASTKFLFIKLIHIFNMKYQKCVVRFRDLLVYTYRFVLKWKGQNANGLDKICAILKNNGEVVRAELLRGEGISDYNQAKEHFNNVIRDALAVVNNGNNDFWAIRMLGVAYNRLANLEKQHQKMTEAKQYYTKGKEQFEAAKEKYDFANNLSNNITRQDGLILNRDIAISNERLGDIAFAEKDYSTALKYYQEYNKACVNSYQNTASLKNKWDYSTSLLRLGDVLKCLEKKETARQRYCDALRLRQEIIQTMQYDVANIFSPYSLENCPVFFCSDESPIIDRDNPGFDRVPRESRDIEPVRDLAMCYVRLGDLAWSIDATQAAKFLYEAFVEMCQFVNEDMAFCEERAKRLENVS